MAQVSRQLRKAFLLLLPRRVRQRVFERYPNFRKAAPEGMKFVFDHYLDDIRVNVDTRFRVEKFMWTGVFDADLTALMERVLKPGCVACDIGANSGAVTLPMARMVGASGRVLAVEAAPPTYARLLANLRLNPSLESRVTALNLGVGSAEETLFWNEESDNPGNGWLGATGSLPVKIVTLDSVLSARPVARMDFMKIDVEGMELAVMRGAEAALRRHQPVLYFETLARFRNAGGSGNFRRIGDFLGELGYDLFRLGHNAQLSPTTVGDLDSNTVAVARSRRAEFGL
jgi:FkbM family methyltransferase